MLFHRDMLGLYAPVGKKTFTAAAALLYYSTFQILSQIHFYPGFTRSL